MSDAPTDAAPKKKGGKMKKLVMIGGGIVLLLGAGAGAGFYASGGGAGGHEAVKEDPNAPKLVMKEGAEEHGAPADHPKAGAGGHGDADEGGADMSAYKATYYPLEQNFTSNLRDSDGFAQIGLGIATYYDAKLVDAIKENEMPIRSAVLLALADQDAMVLSTPEGKKKLQKELTAAINEVLKEKTGYAGVDDVYFTSFIIQ